MSLFELVGTITSIGQSVFSNDGTVYAYLEISDAEGRRTLVERVGVCNDVGSRLALGLSGRFYVDRFFRSGNLRCQLWGVKTERDMVIDATDLRVRIAVIKILQGIPGILVLGLGLFFIASGIGLLVQCARNDRKKFFFEDAAPPPLPVATMRI
jgi:hypothetical protein